MTADDRSRTMEWKLGLNYVDDARKLAVKTGNEELAKALVRSACLMARSEVNTGIELSERYFHAYATDGEVLNRFHEKSWQSIGGWVESADMVRFLSLPVWDAWEELQDSVFGLGPAKAAMALALMGRHEIGCIDRHMMADTLGLPVTIVDAESGKRVANPAVEQEYKRRVTRRGYRAFHDVVFAGKRKPRDAQWLTFWRLKDADTKGTPGASFRRSSHMPYFAVVVDQCEELAR
jgi:hypothetical protein